MKKLILVVLVVIFVGLLVSSCGGKAARSARNAARDIRNSVKSQLTGKGGKSVSSGPLFGRRAYYVPSVGTVNIPVVLVSLWDKKKDGSYGTAAQLWPDTDNATVKGYYASLFSNATDPDHLQWRDQWTNWLGYGQFSMREYYEHQSFDHFHVMGDIITSGQQPQTMNTPADCKWLQIPDSRIDPANPSTPVDISWDSLIGRPGVMGALKTVSLNLRSGIDMDVTDSDMVKMKLFLNFIVDWLNNYWPDGNDPATPPDPPFLNHTGRGLYQNHTDFNDGNLDSADSSGGYRIGYNYLDPTVNHGTYWTPALGNRTDGQNEADFFSTGYTWLDNFDWRNLFQGSSPTPVLDNLTIVIAGPPWDDGQTHYPDLREAAFPINKDWGIHQIKCGPNETDVKNVGSVTILFEKIYNPYLVCHEFGHVLGLPDLYDQRNGLINTNTPPNNQLQGDNGIGNKSLMGDMVGLDVPDSSPTARYNGDDSSSADLDSDYSKTSTANDLDCYSRYLLGWIPPGNAHILTVSSAANGLYNLAPGNALLQVPIPLINSSSNSGHFYAIPLVGWYEQAELTSSYPQMIQQLPSGFGELYWGAASYPEVSPLSSWPEWLLLENRGPSTDARWDAVLSANSSSTAQSPDPSFTGLLMWRLDSRGAVGGLSGAALLGIQSEYNDGFIHPYNTEDPGNCKFLRLLEADGIKKDTNATPAQYVLADSESSTDPDARYGDKWDVWGCRSDGTGTQQFSPANGSSPDDRQLPFLTPYQSGLFWWNDPRYTTTPNVFDVLDGFHYVNSDEGAPTFGGDCKTGILIRNIRKGGVTDTNQGIAPVYTGGAVLAYPSMSGWPQPDETPGDHMMFADIFRLPAGTTSIEAMNAVRIISVSGATISNSSGPTVVVHVYAANSDDHADTASGKVYLEYSSGNNNWLPVRHMSRNVFAVMDTGHGARDLQIQMNDLPVGTYDLRVGFRNQAWNGQQQQYVDVDEVYDTLSNYFSGQVFFSVTS